MSKKYSSESQSSQVGYGNAYVIGEDFTGHIIGRVLTLIETLGLPEKQEEAIKGLARQMIYGDFYEMSVYIGSDLNTAIKTAYWEKKKKCVDTPMSAILLGEIK